MFSFLVYPLWTAVEASIMPTAPFVPYWVVAQREETDLQALKSLMQGELAEFDEEIEGAA